MYFRVDDGNVVFADYLIRAEIPEDKRALFIGFQCEPDGIVCYSEQEKVRAEETLTQEEVPFETEEINFTPEQKAKVEGIKYASRSEAIAHLLEDKEPESQVIPNLKREKARLAEELTKTRGRLTQTEDALLTVMFGKKVEPDV